MKVTTVLIGCFLITLLSACAFDVVRVKQIPTQLESRPSAKDSFILEKEANIDLGTGYSRVLRKGTRWVLIGAIPQGEVFKTNDQILTIEASNIHEAYIVTKAGKLIGFYLPVERTFSPLNDPVDLFIKGNGL